MLFKTHMRRHTSQLRIVRMRRDYNAWAADQSREDYALRFTAHSARAATPLRAALTALGSLSFLALEAIGGALTLTFGFTNTLLAILLACVVIFLVSLPITIAAARSGLDIDLLTRGAGFGYIGSTLTSLIYASFTFLFFGIETAIMAAMLSHAFTLPTWLANIIAAGIIIPLATGGFKIIARFQIITLPIWLILNITPLLAALILHPEWLHIWHHITAPHMPASPNLFAIGSAASVMMVLICQSAEQIDFLRFLPERTPKNTFSWWSAAIIGGPGWILLDAAKLLAGSFLASIALHYGLSPNEAAQPQAMYRLAYGTILSPPFAIMATLALVCLAQTKINITNAYAGSLAWSNFFSRLTHSHPGRIFYIFFTIGIALILLENNIVSAVEHGITFYALIATSWIGAIVADITLCKPLKLSPPIIEFHRAMLPDLNPVGLGATGIGVVTGIASLSASLGPIPQAFAPFLSLMAAYLSAPLIAYSAGSSVYLARHAPARHNHPATDEQTCTICERPYEAPDMAYCPAYNGLICSLCCTLDARCHDRCKPPTTRLSAQIARPFTRLPYPLIKAFKHPIGRFCLIFSGLLLGVTLLKTSSLAQHHAYLLLCLCAAIGSLLIILVQQSHRTATEETERQTRLLLNEIEAHTRTNDALTRAHDKAEAASRAKTRYLSGISHEIRAPLNTIMGYTQILETDPRFPAERHSALRTIRDSGEHMTALLTGLLDISRIEGGRIEIYRDRIAFAQFLESVVQMVRVQATAKGLEFDYSRGPLPAMVNGDEYRIRQILLNLLSNAIKFTPTGRVSFHVKWRNQVAEFIIKDTGPGIASEHQERIFEPFERAAGDTIPGTGLGLTITRLLTEILGGELTFTSSQTQDQHGTRFRVRLLLSDRNEDIPAGLTQLPAAYRGPKRHILIIDDNPQHRDMLTELLTSRGFSTQTASNAKEGLARIAAQRPDLLLLDSHMPGMTGRDLAQHVREALTGALPIIFITGNMAELAAQRAPSLEDCPILGKPVDFVALFEAIGRILALEWGPLPTPSQTPPIMEAPSSTHILPADNVATLRRLLERGDLRAFRHLLEQIAQTNPALKTTLAPLQDAAQNYQLATLEDLLKEAPK